MTSMLIYYLLFIRAYKVSNNKNNNKITYICIISDRRSSYDRRSRSRSPDRRGSYSRRRSRSPTRRRH